MQKIATDYEFHDVDKESHHSKLPIEETLGSIAKVHRGQPDPNKRKSEFDKKSITFFEFVFLGQGISPDP